MAAEGLRLRAHYGSPACSPSRASLLTGCYAKRVLPIAGVLFPSSAVGLNPAEQSLSKLLKNAGYTTACIGKWHLGDQPKFLPTRHGFDFFFGIPYSNDMGPEGDGARSNLGDPLPDPAKAPPRQIDESGWHNSGYPPIPILRDEKVVGSLDAAGQQSLTHQFTTEAESFIRANKDRAFFLYLPHFAIHFPLYPSDKFHGKSTNGLYGDWVEEMDWSVGRILDLLRGLGLENNTLVIFTSDNGANPQGNNAPFRGHKNTTWEGGVRVPTLAWWPGRIPAGSSTYGITAMMDILPTLASLAGENLDEAHKIDGLDLSKLLLNGAASPREEISHFRGLQLSALRVGKWKFQLTAPSGSPNPYVPTLYDLENDPGETNDVLAKHPAIEKDLLARIAMMHQDLGNEGCGPGVRPIGRVPSPRPLIAPAGP